MNFNIVHDFDYPLFKRATCLRRAFWLCFYAVFRDVNWLRRKLPKWLLHEKYNQCLTVALIDKFYGLNSVFALTEDVQEHFPSLQGILEAMGFRVTEHWHLLSCRRGYAGTKGRGVWKNYVAFKKHYMNYDRRYVLENKRVTPDEGTSVVWHIDHMPYNLLYYLNFLDSLGFNPIYNIHPTVKVGDAFRYYPPIYIGKETRIGDNVKVGKFLHIDENVIIGSNVIIEGFVYISPKTEIGNDVFLGPETCILNAKYPMGGKLVGAKIRDNAIIGGNSTILPVTIGEHSVIGAGSVVTKNVPSFEVWYGNPAQFRMTRKAYDMKMEVAL